MSLIRPLFLIKTPDLRWKAISDWWRIKSIQRGEKEKCKFTWKTLPRSFPGLITFPKCPQPVGNSCGFRASIWFTQNYVNSWAAREGWAFKRWLGGGVGCGRCLPGMVKNPFGRRANGQRSKLWWSPDPRFHSSTCSVFPRTVGYRPGEAGAATEEGAPPPPPPPRGGGGGGGC